MAPTNRPWSSTGQTAPSGRSGWATVGRSASTTTAISIPRFSTPTGGTAFTSSRACSARRSWTTSSATSPSMLERAPSPQRARRRPPRPARARRRLPKRRNYSWVKPLSDPVGGTDARSRPPSEQRCSSRRRRRARPSTSCSSSSGRCSSSEACLRVYGHRDLLSGGSGRQRAGLRAVQRGGVDQAPGTRRFGGVAPGRLDALGLPNSTRAATGSTSWRSSTAATRPTGCGWCRGRTPSARPTSRRWSQASRFGSSARSGAAHLRPGRRRHHQPPGDPRLVRQHQPRPRVTINFGFHRRKLGPRRDQRGRAQRRRPSTTRRAWTSGRRRSCTPSTPGAQRYPDEQPILIPAVRRPRGRVALGRARSGFVWRATTCSTSGSDHGVLVQAREPLSQPGHPQAGWRLARLGRAGTGVSESTRRPRRP